MGRSILKKRIGIEKQIDDFLDQVSELGLLFKSGIDTYHMHKVSCWETESDKISTRLQRNIPL